MFSFAKIIGDLFSAGAVRLMSIGFALYVAWYGYHALSGTLDKITTTLAVVTSHG